MEQPTPESLRKDLDNYLRDRLFEMGVVKEPTQDSPEDQRRREELIGNLLFSAFNAQNLTASPSRQSYPGECYQILSMRWTDNRVEFVVDRTTHHELKGGETSLATYYGPNASIPVTIYTGETTFPIGLLESDRDYLQSVAEQALLAKLNMRHVIDVSKDMTLPSNLPMVVLAPRNVDVRLDKIIRLIEQSVTPDKGNG